MKISEWEVEELYDYIEPMWEEKEYFTWHKYYCKNCRGRAPGNYPYMYCPHCGHFMRNGKIALTTNGTNNY